MKWSEIVELVGNGGSEESDAEIKWLATDSRLITDPSSTLFFAIRGAHRDGHDFIAELIQQGVRHYIVEKPILTHLKVNYLQVSSVISALQQIAQAKRERSSIPIVGITGSNGKTSIKEWLSLVLSEQHAVAKSPKSYNSQIGVPLSVWQLGQGHDFGVFEAGISLPGEMDNLNKVIQPTMGIFSNIGFAHDEGFESRIQKIREKALLFQGSEKVICCKDHLEVYEVLKASYPDNLISWSSSDEDCKYYCAVNDSLISFVKQKLQFHLPFDFPIWQENALHTIVAALELGIEPVLIQEVISKLKPVGMRLEIKQGINGTYLIDDTYNNDLHALKVALDFLKQQKQHQRRTLILTDIYQSGLSPAELYGQVNNWLYENEIDRLIGIGPHISSTQLDWKVPITSFFQSVDDLLDHLPDFGSEMILVKGARTFRLERFTELLEQKHHQTHLEVNFEAIVHNLSCYRKLLNPSTQLMVMVKAFAYGGGSLEIANLLQFHGVDYLGVAYVDEAIRLRKSGITTPIMVMNVDPDQFEKCVKWFLEPEIYGFRQLDKLSQLSRIPKIHLKLDTGMNRLGFKSNEMGELLSWIKLNDHIEVAGIFSHLSSSDVAQEDEFTNSQISVFEKNSEVLAHSLPNNPIKHLINSSGIVRYLDAQFDMVRLGIGLYGYDPVQALDLKPTSQLKTYVSQVKVVESGESIGYNRKGRADKQKQIATIPIGYADGYLRVFGNGNGKLLVKGKLAPTIGNICMDMCMIDVTGLDVEEGDEVIVFGELPSIQDLAKWADTIPYEVLTNVGQRVKRIYLSE
ncbi:MAG: bifunctional UDP-N-acetylmuramoyl-tripeptide:D-alanyl-D-alanine ligase/alanine racemase [Cyclobacteriaceae bacterium]